MKIITFKVKVTFEDGNECITTMIARNGDIACSIAASQYPNHGHLKVSVIKRKLVNCKMFI